MNDVPKKITLMIDTEVFVVLSQAEYDRLTGGTVDALEYTRESIASGLRAARKVSGLSQAQLAKKMNKSQSMVSHAERGAVSVNERFVAGFLKACGLPKDWKPSPARPGLAKLSYPDRPNAPSAGAGADDEPCSASEEHMRAGVLPRRRAARSRTESA